MTPQIDQILNILDAMDEEQNKNHSQRCYQHPPAAIR